MGGDLNSARQLAKEFTCSKRAAAAAVLAIVLAVVLASAALAASTTTLLPATTNTTAPSGSDQAAGSEDLTTRCLTCHSQEYLGTVQDDKGTQNLYIDSAAYHDSAHGLLPCNACHTGFSHDPHKMVNNAEFFRQTANEACRNCHDDQFEMYKQSYHGTLSRGGTAAGEKAPICIDCHGTHAIQKVGTLEYKQSISDVCGKCHGGREATFLDTYHGKAITLGRESAATCVDCHGAHSILPVSNPQSTLSEANILPTCQKCHPDASKGFSTFLVHVKPTSTKAPLIVFAVAVFYLLMIIAVFAFGGIHTLLYIYRGLKDGMYFGKGGGH